MQALDKHKGEWMQCITGGLHNSKQVVASVVTLLCLSAGCGQVQGMLHVVYSCHLCVCAKTTVFTIDVNVHG